MFTAQQQSAFSGFTYDLFDAQKNKIGSLNWPDYPVATNARLKDVVPKALSTKIEIKLGEKNYEIAFEYLTRNWFNDIRFMLMDGDTTLASAGVIKSKKMFARKNITVLTPFEGKVIRKSTLFTTRYEVLNKDTVIGTIAERAALTTKRELTIGLPSSISAPIQFFLLFLVCNDAYR